MIWFEHFNRKANQLLLYSFKHHHLRKCWRSQLIIENTGFGRNNG